ncbi:hypothetical protein D9M69_670500 [compost metagenome]
MLKAAWRYAGFRGQLDHPEVLFWTIVDHFLDPLNDSLGLDGRARPAAVTNRRFAEQVETVGDDGLRNTWGIHVALAVECASEHIAERRCD